ncbi:two-partner secretion domain-containing protein [Acaryochloris marina]|nr:filamentous hemagglutinin N-terminal domain-containing protein [Acaryochloris marina]BDM82254.1 hypothetical protein AM10699_51180 [Acaryochloris marina MBIC10699]
MEAVAQIVPDATLPSDSVVDIQGNLQRITGGTTVGNNLFHSFKEFSVSTDSVAIFDHDLSIGNVITRITGRNVSTIDGLITGNGTANLFLINPNGLIFGANGQIDIGGSFIASTADSLHFGDGSIFSAVDHQTPTLLTISTPVGLQFGESPRTVINRSQATQIGQNGMESLVGLQVKPGKTLALVGGDVNVEGGYLTSAGGTIDLSGVGATLEGRQLGSNAQTSGGRIEVGAVGANSYVQISQSSENVNTFSLNYDGVEKFQNILFSNLAVLDASGDGGGEIQIRGQQVKLNEGSLIQSNTLGNKPGGTITISATDSLQVLGNTLTNGPLDTRLAAAGILTPRLTNITSSSFSEGQAGNIEIEAGKVIVEQGAEIAAFSFGLGRGGDVSIRVAGFVDISGQSIPLGFVPERFFPFGFDVPGFSDASFRSITLSSNISAASIGSGRAGNILIDAKKLIIGDGGLVTAGPLFSGNGGSIVVNASDSVEVSGTSRYSLPPNLAISRSRLSVASFGSGDTQSLAIKTKRLIVRDGGAVEAASFATGASGSLSIEASEVIDISGFSFSPRDGLLQSAVSASSFGSSDAGDLSLITDQLILRNGAELAVNSINAGDAGNLEVIANSIYLDSMGEIIASTASGKGGNILLRVQENLLLRNKSLISTNADGTGEGGNINIGAKFIIAPPIENSDIVANAVTGRGGKIQIQTQGIFGLVPREQLSSTSDITASSEFGVSGTIEIQDPEVDPSDGLADLPETIEVNPPITQGCRPGQTLGGSTFVHVGRGGTPLAPTQLQTAPSIWHDLRGFPILNEKSFSEQNHLKSDSSPEMDSPNQPPQSVPISHIEEAKGWTRNKQGRIVLTNNIKHTAHNSGQPSVTC